MSKRLCTCVLVLLLLTLLAVPSQASLEWTRITNPGNGPGDPDGIVPGGDRNNSYAWSMGTLPTSEGTYLYVGSNRNLAYPILLGNMIYSDEEIMSNFEGAIPTDKDFRGRIFRYNIDGSQPWEEVYISPVTFSGDIGDYERSADHPFPKMPRATVTSYYGGPETNVIFGQENGYRGMETFTPEGETESRLYVATYDGIMRGNVPPFSRVLEIDQDFEKGDTPIEVLRVQTDSLRSTTIHNSQLYIGADKIYETTNPQPLNSDEGEDLGSWQIIATSDDLQDTKVWDLISYNDYLYAFTIGGNISQGFCVFKGHEKGLAEEGTNEAGWVWETIAGSEGRYPPSMGHIRPNAASPFIFQNKVYVGTFASMPTALAVLSYELMTGRETGTLRSITPEEAFNNFRNRLDPPQIYRFDKDDNWELIVGDPSENLDLSGNRIFQARLGNYGGGFFNPNLLQLLAGDTENYSFLQYVWRMEPYEGKLYTTTFDIRVFLRYFTNFVTDPDKLVEIETLLSRIDLYNPDPAGTNIYRSEDGINWTPVITDGFGDPYNYGGRTIKATDKGLFVGTANPFWGAQVWKAMDSDSTEESTTTTEETETSGSSGSGCNIGYIYPYALLLFPLLIMLGKKTR